MTRSEAWTSPPRCPIWRIGELPSIARPNDYLEPRLCCGPIFFRNLTKKVMAQPNREPHVLSNRADG